MTEITTPDTDRNALIMRGWSAADSLDRAPGGIYADAAQSLRTIARVALQSRPAVEDDALPVAGERPSLTEWGVRYPDLGVVIHSDEATARDLIERAPNRVHLALVSREVTPWQVKS